MHAIIIFLYYLSKLLNLTLNLESLSSSFLNKLILLVNFSAAGKLFQLVITLLLNVDFPIIRVKLLHKYLMAGTDASEGQALRVYGNLEELKRTAAFVRATGISI